MIEKWDAWSTSRLSQRPSEPVYFIEEIWISSLKNTQADLTLDQWTHTKNISLVWTLVRLYNKPDQSRQGFALESNNVLALSSRLSSYMKSAKANKPEWWSLTASFHACGDQALAWRWARWLDKFRLRFEFQVPN